MYLARLVTHPNVCRIFDLGYHDTASAGCITFLTMELLAGETLLDRLARTGPMTTTEALPLVHQLVEGLTAAHRAGIIHRDFKSGNVILSPQTEGSPDGAGVQIKIMDFGLARAMTGAGDARTTLTVAGGLIGTPAYMAPEQIEGGEITAATDIYALGVVMYEMIAGVLPFVGDSPWIVATKRLREPPASPRTHVPELDPTWESVILRCLERSSAARFQNAADVSRALSGEHISQVKTFPAKHESDEREPVRKGIRPRTLAVAAIAILLASVTGYYLLRTSVGASARRAAELAASAPARYGWRQVAMPADASLSQIGVVSGSLDPVQLLLFGPAFARAWVPGQNITPPLPTAFSIGGQAECAPDLWLIHDDNRHITKWDSIKQQALTTIALPWSFTSAICLDDKATRWGFLVGRQPSQWMEFDAKTKRTVRTVPLDGYYLRATLDPARQLLLLIGDSRISVRSADHFDEVFHDTLGEKLIGRWASSWSESGRYLALGFKQLVIFDFAAKRRVRTLATAGWISGIGWIGDNSIGAMDDRGRLYWTSDILKDWQLKQEPPAPGVYQPFWIGSHNRWIALGAAGGGLAWEYSTPSLLFDLPVSPLEVWSVAASPEGTPSGAKLAVAGKDPRIFVVDTELKKTVQVLEGHTDGVPFIRFAGPDRLISASDDKTLRVWDSGNGKLLKTVSGHESLVNAFGISPDGNWLVSVSSDSKVKLWGLPGLSYVKDIGTTVNAGASAAFLEDGKRLLTSDWKGNLSTYEGRPPDLPLRQQFRLGNSVIYMLCPSHNAWWGVVSDGEAAGLWSIPAGDITKATQVTKDTPYYCSTASDGRLTAIQYPNKIDVRTNDDGKLAASYRYAARDGAAVAIRYHPTIVVGGFANGHVLAWPVNIDTRQ